MQKLYNAVHMLNQYSSFTHFQWETNICKHFLTAFLTAVVNYIARLIGKTDNAVTVSFTPDKTIWNEVGHHVIWGCSS